MDASVPPPRSWRSSLRAALLPALLLTLLNAPKPVHIDDTAYCFFAAQAAAHPLDPLGFKILWDQKPQPAVEVPAPPLVTYWLAAGMKLFGPRPFLWKLWFLPFILLLGASFHWLLRRFARGVEQPLLWLVLLSPAILPALNLMLDVPMLGLSLFSLCLFFHAGDRESLPLTLLAGLAAGLAIETKHAALLAPAVMTAVGILRRKPWSGGAAAAVAGAIFVAWEGMNGLRYGTCQFVTSVFHFPFSVPKSQILLPAVVYVGGLAPALLVLGVASLKVRPRIVLLLAGLFLLVLPGIALLPDRWAEFLEDRGEEFLRLSPLTLLFLLTGASLIGLAAALAWKLAGRRGNPGSFRGFPFSRPADRILAAWLCLELAGCIALSPFMAARRVLPLIVVLALLFGRYAALTRRPQKRILVAIAAFSVALGLGYAAVDYREADAQRESVDRAARWIEERHEGGKVWYAGHWGFQYYADRQGMAPIIPDGSALRPGDWLVIPERRISQQIVILRNRDVELAQLLELDDTLPYRTVMGYWAGKVPLERRRGPRLSVEIYRVRSSFVPSRR